MRTIRIYQAQTLALHQTIHLDESAGNHVFKVLRLQAGALLTLFNGDNHEYQAVIETAHKKGVSVRITAIALATRESPLSFHLVQGIARGEKMEWIIQKAVELGVTEITPLFTEFSNVKLQGERLDKKQNHWQRIAISACEQCERNVVPTVHEPMAYPDWIARHKPELGLILHPYQSQSIAELPETAETVTLLVGPEGGFSDKEVAMALQQNFTALALGPRILRTETAPLMALSILQARWGDI